jgi:hypothetical protein
MLSLIDIVERAREIRCPKCCETYQLREQHRAFAANDDQGALSTTRSPSDMINDPDLIEPLLVGKRGDWLNPVVHIWLRSAQPWVQIPDSVLRYATQPADYTPILEA